MDWLSLAHKYADLVWPLPITDDNIRELQGKLNETGLSGVPQLNPSEAFDVPTDTNSGRHKWEQVDIPWDELDDVLLWELRVTAWLLGVEPKT